MTGLNLTLSSLFMLGNFNGIESIIIGVIGFYMFLRILSIIRVSRDIHERTHSIIFQIVCILIITSFSPIIGLPIYLAMRPIRYVAKSRRNN